MADVKVPKVEPQSRLQINRIAVQFLRECAPKNLKKPAPLDVLEVLEYDYLYQKFGFNFRLENLPEKLEGYTDFTNRDLVLNANVYDGIHANHPRDRFTGMHEVGHVVLHYKQMTDIIYENKNAQKFYRKDIPSYIDPEWQANEFSGAALMPLDHMIIAVNENWSINDVEEIFSVSRLSAEIRLKNVSGLINNNPYLLIERGLF